MKLTHEYVCKTQKLIHTVNRFRNILCTDIRG